MFLLPENKSSGSGGGECVITTAATSPWAFAYGGGGRGGHADGEIYSVAKAVVVVSAVASFKFKGDDAGKPQSLFSSRPQSVLSSATVAAAAAGEQ